MTNRELEMLKEDCRRFQVLLELRLVDESELPESEAAFFSSHEKRCDECGTYASMLDTMGAFEPDQETDEASSVRAIVGASFDERNMRRRRVVLALAASLVAVLGLVFYRLTDFLEEGPEFDVTVGALMRDGVSVGQGERFHFGSDVVSPISENALIQIPGALTVAVAKEAEIRLLASDAQKMRIALDKGRLAIHLVPDAQVDLTVVLPDGEIDVVGTVFIVDAGRGESHVEVVKGAVAVTSRRGDVKRRRLDAGWRLSLESGDSRERRPTTQDPLLRLLGIRDQAVAVEAPDETRQEAVTNKDAASDPPNATAEDKAATSPATGPKPSLESLMASARECRVNRDWDCAVSRYRNVISYYPSRPDAATAMISAAQILLDKMKEPADALTYFRRYQRRRPTGGLGREALFGECSALKALGRTSQEQACLEKYLDKYPGTLYSKMAKTRLNSIVNN